MEGRGVYYTNVQIIIRNGWTRVERGKRNTQVGDDVDESKPCDPS